MAQAGLAAGSAANLRKGAAKGGSAAGLFFLLLGLSFFIVLDYYSRFSPFGESATSGKTVALFIAGSLILTASGFVPYMTMSRKGNAKAKSAAPGTSMAVYLLVSGLMGLGLGKMGAAEGITQSVILTNMYVLLGSILGFNAQASRGDTGARSNSVMAALGLILLALFDAMGAKSGETTEVKTPGAEEVANAKLKELEEAVTNAQADINKAGAMLVNNTEEMKAGKLALQQKLGAAQKALEAYKATPKA